MALNTQGGGGLVAKSCQNLVTLWTGESGRLQWVGILQARILEWVAISKVAT